MEIRRTSPPSGIFFPPLLCAYQQEAEDSKRPLLVMFEDEARFGRITTARDCWAPPGIRPVIAQQAIREYTYVYAAVAPESGVIDTLILPDMYATTLSIFLKELSERHSTDLILLVMDGAPCHRAGAHCLTVPENIRLHFLPPYSPQLNPVETVWDYMRGHWFANMAFKDMPAVENHLVSILQQLDTMPDTIRSITSFPYIEEGLKGISKNWK